MVCVRLTIVLPFALSMLLALSRPSSAPVPAPARAGRDTFSLESLIGPPSSRFT